MFRRHSASRSILTWTVLMLFVVGAPAMAFGDEKADKKPDYNQLRRQLRVAYANVDYKKALQIAEEMHKVRPGDIDAMYNIACFNCLLGDKEKAYTWLEKAAAAGYRDADYLLNDYDFKTMRAEDRFRKLIQQMRKTARPAEPEDEPQKAEPEESLTPGQHAQKLHILTHQLGDLARDGKKTEAWKAAREALKHAIALHKANGERADAHLSMAHYNVACMASILDKDDVAFKHLRKAIKFGGFNESLRDTIAGDNDFDNIRKDPRFKKMLKLAEAADKRRAAKKQKTEADKHDRDEAHHNDAKEKASGDAAKARSFSEHSRRLNALTNELVQVARDGDVERALRLAMEALKHAQALEEAVGEEAHPALALAHYNVACMCSLLKQADDAFDQLFKCIEYGGWGPNLLRQLENDADFDNIRHDARFEKALRLVGKSEAKEEETVKKPLAANAAKEEKKTDGDNDIPSLSAQGHNAKVAELTQRLVIISNEGKREEALATALQALAHAKALQKLVGDLARPALALTHYNAACMCALLDKQDDAVEHLDLCVKAGGFGGSLAVQIANDPDFDSIREDPRYAKTLEEAKRLKPPVSQREALNANETRVEFQWKVTLPKGFDKSKKAPLLVALHHYNGSMDIAAERWKKAADAVGAILLTPQGTVKMSGADYHWGRDLNRIESDVMDAINRVMDKYEIDDDKIALAGFSQGGWATWALALRNPDAFCGVVPVAGFFSPEAPSQLEDEDLGDLRVFIMLGEGENGRVIASNEEAVKALTKLGATIRMNVYNDVGHAFPKNETEEMTKALKFVFGD